MPCVSIIVPVYNAGRYLEDCLETLSEQSLKEIEIILVLDCPTDGSDIICEKFAQKDSRIKILKNSENLHIGLSRNKGLDIATGEYVGFSDDDDYRDLAMYTTLYDIAKREDADMVTGVTVNETDGNRKVFYYPKLRKEDFREFALSDLIGCGGWRDLYPLCINIHPHIYRRSLIEKYHIRFVDTKKVSPEDRLFNINFLLHSRKISHCSQPLYYHRMLQQSAGHQRQYMQAEKFIRYTDQVFGLLFKNECYDLYKPWFYIGAGRNMMGMAFGILQSTHNPLEFRKLLLEMSKRRYCSEVFSHYVLQQRKIKYRLLEYITKHILSKKHE